MARSFNGSEYVDMGSSATLQPASISMSAWFKSNFANSYNTILGGNTGGVGFNVLVKSSKQMAVYAVGGQYDGSGSQTATTGWNHFAVTNGGGGPFAATAWLNDVVDVSGISLANAGASATHVRIGSDGIGGAQDPMVGQIADVAIWNGTLTAAEVDALSKGARPYQIRRTSLTLVGYWPLDGLSSPEPDLSGNAFNGTLTGTSLAAGPPTTMFSPRWPQMLPPPPPLILMPQACL